MVALLRSAAVRLQFHPGRPFRILQPGTIDSCRRSLDLLPGIPEIAGEGPESGSLLVLLQHTAVDSCNRLHGFERVSISDRVGGDCADGICNGDLRTSFSGGPERRTALCHHGACGYGLPAARFCTPRASRQEPRLFGPSRSGIPSFAAATGVGFLPLLPRLWN